MSSMGSYSYWIGTTCLIYNNFNLTQYKGLFINDVMQVGEGGWRFCDAMYEGLIKTFILVWGGRGSEVLQFVWRH